MNYLLIILAIIPFLSFTQQKYDTIYLVHYVSNPPMSEFICDTGKCEGFCESYFDNGSLHRKGKFEDGQPIDTLFEFHPNGKIEEVFIPNEKGWRMMNYYQSGQLKSEYDAFKRNETEYYSSGVLKKEHSWNRKIVNT